MTDEAGDAYRRAEVEARRIAELTGVERHDVAVVLGSGWAPMFAVLGEPECTVPFSKLLYVPVPTVAGHEPSLHSLAVGRSRVLLLAGRAHLYEGHGVATVVHAVRTAVIGGCTTVVLTNAAGTMRDDLAIGDPVLIADHINLTGRNPLAGPPPPDPYRARFVDMTAAYSPRLRGLVLDVDASVREGVYAGLLGPSYETPAEVRMLRGLGADLVGMSTVLEAIAAVHLGAEVLGITLVTNLAAGMQGDPLAHAEVVEAGRKNMGRVGSLLRAILERL